MHICIWGPRAHAHMHMHILTNINNYCEKSVGIRRSFLRQSACEFFVAVWAGIACQNFCPACRSVVIGRWIRPPHRRSYACAKVISSVVSARRSFDSELSTHLGICMLIERKILSKKPYDSRRASIGILDTIFRFDKQPARLEADSR